ncbi:MAG TPA: GNAT family N-acetyltransferase [Membranihabitans sp.]|nr:GNAT family N-acetyltransferase [Membranihabitans sp.]
MEILHQDDGSRGAFYIVRNDATVAKMTYVWARKSKIIIDHTEVGEELRGLGAGKQMVEKAVEFARERNVRILPLCPFAKSVFAKNKDYSDVL